MFALVSAVMFFLGAVLPKGEKLHSSLFWLLLGLGFLALHMAFTIVLTRLVNRNAQSGTIVQ